MVQGKIYKIINDINAEIYIGSTKSTLAKRLYQHKNRSIKNPNQKIYNFINEIGWTHVRIILIENIDYTVKDELYSREQYHIDLLKPSLNSRGAKDTCPHGRTQTVCKECKGSYICIHNRIKNTCVQCHGVGICIHNRIKTQCKDCHGSAICIHNRAKTQCIQCNGSGLCIHEKQTQSCKICSPIICEFCHTLHPKSKFNRHINTDKHKNNYKDEFLINFGTELKDDDIKDNYYY